MESVLAIALFELALVVPPLVVAIGIAMLTLPSRPKEVARPHAAPHAA